MRNKQNRPLINSSLILSKIMRWSMMITMKMMKLKKMRLEVDTMKTLMNKQIKKKIRKVISK